MSFSASVQSTFAPDMTARPTLRLPAHGSVPGCTSSRAPAATVTRWKTYVGPRQRRARAIQWRDRDANDFALLGLTRPVRPVAAPYSALVFVDARIEVVCSRAGAHVAHLVTGQSHNRGTCGGGNAIGHATTPPTEPEDRLG
jgi:thiamine monophosphate synthase